MPRIIIEWCWEEAFSKWGFNDGDVIVMTDEGAQAIGELGYEVEVGAWGVHNEVITSIVKEEDGFDLSGDVLSVIEYNQFVGADIRNHLPADLVEHLDRTFPDDKESGYPWGLASYA